MRWRYLTLGFGDQMAWLSANSLAATVDGNYHSARRLPELTSRPVERLENAKFLGGEGMASLKDFLTASEKYSLKYVFSNDRYYDPLLYYTGWTRTIRLENGIMVWEKGNISTIQPIKPQEVRPLLKYTWGIFPISSLFIAFLLTIYYLKNYKEQNYYVTVPVTNHYYPLSIIYSSSLLPVIFFTYFMGQQVYELLMVKEQKDPKTAVVNFYNHLDFQRFEKAFQFFNPSPNYTLDQYLLEKSVRDGGLLPSYAKLDKISVNELSTTKDSALIEVETEWNSSLGQLEKADTLQLVHHKNQWYLIPPEFSSEIPEEQVRSYTFTLFKKQGKRVISPFPTVKDDRVKKPFAVVKQANLIRYGERHFVTGEIVNTDDIPINIALRVVIHYEDQVKKEFYPTSAMKHNLSPKANSYFQVDLDDRQTMDSLKVESIEVHVSTDVSERGYIHGGTPGYHVKKEGQNKVKIQTRFYNELPTDINIPGILIAEKDSTGVIWQSQLSIHPVAIRSGMHIEYTEPFHKIRDEAEILQHYPFDVFINGRPQRILSPQQDDIANGNHGIAILPHCFIAHEIFLQ